VRFGAVASSAESGSHCHVDRRDSASRPPDDVPDLSGAFSVAVHRVRQGEDVLTLIDPAAVRRDPAHFSAWLSARLSVGELQRLMLPPCDERCRSIRHRADAYVVLADLALDPAEPRSTSRWEGWNATLERQHQSGRLLFAGTPANAATRPDRRLKRGTLLTRITSTDPFWVHYDAVPRETLFRIATGRHEGDALIAVTFGSSPLLPGLAGALIVPDHPPVHDAMVANRFLAAGWAAVERGLPHEE
jgi:hypothetical protein